MMKIDMHVHVTPTEISKHYERYGLLEPYFSLLSNTPHNRFATAEQIVRNMEQAGMDKSVIFGFSFRDMGLCQYVNDYVIEACRDYPEHLIGFMSVVPSHPKVAYEIERCYHKGLRGIGELFPAGQPFRLDQKEDTQDFANCCKQYQLPVMIHLNEPVGHDYVGKTKTTLKEAERFILNYPELKMILAHFGGGLWQYELMRELREAFKNVYYDTAAAVFLYDPRIYQMFKVSGLLDKLLFGSDYPLLSPTRYEKSFEESGLGKEDLEKLYGKNAQNFLKACGILID